MLAFGKAAKKDSTALPIQSFAVLLYQTKTFRNVMKKDICKYSKIN